MRQYDICRNKDRGSRNRIPYFVVLQADLLSELATVIVAPLRPNRTSVVIRRLNPLIEIDGKSFFVTMQDLAGIPRASLGPVTANVIAKHREFVAAIDLIFTGI